MKFRIITHTEKGKPIVEAWKNGEIVAAIYGHDDSIRIVSRYLDGVEHDAGYPQGVTLKLSI